MASNVNYTQLQAKQLENGKYQYTTESGVTFETTNNTGSIFVDKNGAIYASNLEGASIKGTDKDDNITLFDSQVNSCDLGKGDETLNAMGTTSFDSSVVFGDNKGDTFNVENKDTAFKNLTGFSEWCKGMFNFNVNTKMTDDEKNTINDTKTAIDDQVKAEEEAKAAEEAKHKASPKSSSVEVQSWGSEAQDGEEYANDCLSRIVANQYGDFANEDNMETIYKAIQELNPQITDPNVILDGDNLKMLEFELDDDGNITGYHEAEEEEVKADSEENTEGAEKAESAKSSQNAEETEKISKEDMHKDIATIAESTNKLGTDEDALAELIGKYAGTGQLEELAEEYKTLHNKDLYEELSHETTGAAQKMIDAMFEDPESAKAPYDLSDETQLAQAAQTIYNAMDGLGTDEEALISILGNPNYSKEDIQSIMTKYNEMFNQDGKEKNSFTNRLDSETSGLFKRLIMERIGANSEE